MGQIPGHSQPQVPGLLCPLESWEVNDLQPHGAHLETAQPGLAAVLLFSFFLLWAPLCRTEVGRGRLAYVQNTRAAGTKWMRLWLLKDF